MKKLLIFGVILLVLGVVAALVAVSFLDEGVRKAVVTFGPRVTRTSVSLDKVSLSIFSGSGKIQGLTVGNPDGYKSEYAMHLKEGFMDIDLGTVTKDVIVIESIRVTGADIIYELGLGNSNIGTLRKNVEAFAGKSGGSEPAESSSSKKVIIKEFILKDCSVKPTAKLVQGKGMAVPLPDLRLTGIGEKTGGETVEEAIYQITSPVFDAVNSAVAGAKDLFRDAGGTIGDTAGDAVNKIKDMFGK